jgi:hypothetical protein
MRGCFSIAPNTGAVHFQRETQKSGQVLVRTREDKTESIDYFKGGMSGVLNLGRLLAKRSGENQAFASTQFLWTKYFLRNVNVRKPASRQISPLKPCPIPG